MIGPAKIIILLSNVAGQGFSNSLAKSPSGSSTWEWDAVVVGVVAAELLTELSPEWGRRGELSVGGRGDSMSCALPLVLLLVVVPLMMDVMCVCVCV